MKEDCNYQNSTDRKQSYLAVTMCLQEKKEKVTPVVQRLGATIATMSPGGYDLLTF
jgi:hypothetical protein